MNPENPQTPSALEEQERRRRFDALQRAAANDPVNHWMRLVPKGVYKFKSHEEANAWEEEWKRKAAEREANRQLTHRAG